ncbi:MAG: amino acid ABC transporter ATP-binding protein [Candidatus Latescibacterota bacterium]|jgi:ABC-type polar amino acid transport system ATPase subunit
MIEVDQVSKRFGETEVLREVSLTFGDGQVTAVLGPSGSGKSTLIRCINGLEKLSAGDIRVNGLSVRRRREVAEIRRQCAMVFQQLNLFPHLTVLQNIVLAPIKVLGKERRAAEAKARELLAAVAMADLAGRYPAELSGGQQQRAAICRALAMEPAHVLLDEVTSALDPEMTVEVLAVIENLARQGTTMVMVTHEIEFARRIADRVVFLEDGRVLADQEGTAFFADPAEERIRRFLAKMDH